MIYIKLYKLYMLSTNYMVAQSIIKIFKSFSWVTMLGNYLN